MEEESNEDNKSDVRKRMFIDEGSTKRIVVINDFYKEELYPNEKFLRKNWQLYLPNDRNSLCWVVMRNLSFPERSDPMDIWNRVVVPSIREKYQSMRCNMTTRIKGIYLSMMICIRICPTLKLSVAKY
jgi:hypothetical protein